MNKTWEAIKGAIMLVILALLIFWLIGMPAGIELQEMGTTHLSNLQLTGDETAGPILTVGDAAAEDSKIVFDGNAQDFYIGLDDSADDLVMGVGSALGTTQGLGIDESANVDIAGTLQYGANDLYALGFASSGQQVVYGTDVITGTATATHGLTTVTFCACTLGEDPESGAGDAAMCTTAVSANVCTIKAWQDDFVTAATETDVVVHWLVIGAP